MGQPVPPGLGRWYRSGSESFRGRSLLSVPRPGLSFESTTHLPLAGGPDFPSLVRRHHTHPCTVVGPQGAFHPSFP